MLTENAVVKEVAKKLNATPAQVLIAWNVHRGHSVIPKSVQESQCNSWITNVMIDLPILAGRIISNFQQIALSEEDYEMITSIGVGKFERWVATLRVCIQCCSLSASASTFPSASTQSGTSTSLTRKLRKLLRSGLRFNRYVVESMQMDGS
jgi:hypothetical protein